MSVLKMTSQLMGLTLLFSILSLTDSEKLIKVQFNEFDKHIGCDNFNIIKQVAAPSHISLDDIIVESICDSNQHYYDSGEIGVFIRKLEVITIEWDSDDNFRGNRLLDLLFKNLMGDNLYMVLFNEEYTKICKSSNQYELDNKCLYGSGLDPCMRVIHKKTNNQKKYVKISSNLLNITMMTPLKSHIICTDLSKSIVDIPKIIWIDLNDYLFNMFMTKKGLIMNVIIGLIGFYISKILSKCGINLLASDVMNVNKKD